MHDEADNGWRGTIEEGDVKRRTERGSSKTNGGAARKSSKARARR
jgi:hypothetical protein